jgi:hypothetical protein
MSIAFQALLKCILRVPVLRSGPNRYGSSDPDCGAGGLPVYCAADRGFVRTNRIRALELRLAGVEAARLRLTRQPPVAVPAVESPVMEAPVLKAAQCCSWPSGLVIRVVNNEPASTPDYISRSVWPIGLFSIASLNFSVKSRWPVNSRKLIMLQTGKTASLQRNSDHYLNQSVGLLKKAEGISVLPARRSRQLRLRNRSRRRVRC